MQRYFRILAGNLLITAAYAFLTVPQGIINGGMTSLCMSLAKVLPLSVSQLSNIVLPLLVAACWPFLGFDYFKGSLFFCLCYLPLFNLFCALHWAPTVPVWLTIPLAGFMVGYGVAVSIRSGATTVGADTIALILHTKIPRIPVAGAMFAINLAVMLFGAATYGLGALIKGILFTTVQTATVNAALRHST